jgi:hypothetical protein
MLWYIIYKLDEVVDDVLSQCSIQKSSLINTMKIMGLFLWGPMLILHTPSCFFKGS